MTGLYRSFFIVLFGVIFSCLAATAIAKTPKQTSASPVPVATTPPPSVEVNEFCSNSGELPPAFHPDCRHNKSRQFELMIYGGSLLGATTEQTWNAGGRFYYHFNNDIALGANYGLSYLYINTDDPFGRQLKTRWMQMINAEIVFSNDIVMRFGKKLVNFDLYGTLGVGAIEMSRAWDPVGVIGGGLKWYTPVRWLALRLDVYNYLHISPDPDEPFDVDVTFLGGLSFLFPKERCAATKK